MAIRVAVALCVVFAIGCSGRGEHESAVLHSNGRLQGASLHAASLVKAHRDAFQLAPPVLPNHGLKARLLTLGGTRPVLVEGVVRGWVRDGDLLRPELDPASGSPGQVAPPAQTLLPVLANGAFQLQDVPSGLSVDVTLRGASAATVEVADGYVVYPAAYEASADVLHRPYPSGTEESIAFATKPSAERVVYDVALGSSVAGVRLVANTVEFVDGQGTPRLRMAPPFIAGAQSTSGWPAVAVGGCDFDPSPAAPWGRPVVPPRSRTCAVTVDWSQAGVQYPAVLDPSWTVGSTMAVGRMHHAGAVVTANGKQLALAFGGYAFTSTLSSAELFDPTTGTWAQTGSLIADTSFAPAVTLANGNVLAVGGFRVSASGGSVYDGVQAYNPTSGQWTLQGHLGAGREEHTATLLANGQVLVVGGFGAYPQVFASALLYQPSTGQTTAAGNLQSARGDHTATLLANGQVLVVDGLGPAATPASASDLYDPVANTWSTVPPPPFPARFSHVAPLLPNGQVLIAGGEDLNAGIQQTLATALYDPVHAKWTPTPATALSHYTGTAVVLAQGATSGKVLVAGGDFGLSSVEMFDPATSSWSSIAPLLTGRDSHVALTLSSGVLFLGGSDSNGNILSSSELYQPDSAALSPQWPQPSGLTVTATGPGSVMLSWPTASDPRGVQSYAVYENGQLVATVSGTSRGTTITGLATGTRVTFTVQAVDPSGVPSSTGPSVVYDVNPLVAPPIADRTVASDLATVTSFLYTGAGAIQQGVDAGTIVPATAAVIRGHVFNATGAGLPGATITIANHPELGSTVSRGDGEYDVAVNGGQVLRVHVALAGYLPAERAVQTPWKDYVRADDVVLVPMDANSASIALSDAGTGGFQVARGSTQTDSDGTRTATLLFPPGTTATLTLPDGGTTPAPGLTVHATEYTQGANGLAKMPATLPSTSAYTYAVELSADEVPSSGATGVSFSQPLPFYLENFLGFQPGTVVPVGYYSTTLGAWVPSANGVVLTILSEPSGGPVTVDATGSGTATPMPFQGITQAELQQLPGLGYGVGQSLWRVPVPHFSVFDCNWPPGPPADAVAPAAGVPQLLAGDGPGACEQSGSIIDCQDQTLRERMPLAGTPYSLYYASNRQHGRVASIQIPLSGTSIPNSLTGIELEIHIAGQTFTSSFPALANQSTTFTWNGLDAYGRRLQGAQPVVVRVGNEYAGVYQSGFNFGSLGTGVSTSHPTRNQVILWTQWNGTLGGWDSTADGLGGWTLDVHHVLDPASGTLRMGDGTVRHYVSGLAQSSGGTISTVAGNGTATNLFQTQVGNGGPAVSAPLSPISVAVGADRSVYVGDTDNCVRRVTPDGIINGFAGQCGVLFGPSSGDGGPAIQALISSPQDLAIGVDGSVYIVDIGHGVRRVDPTGTITTVFNPTSVTPISLAAAADGALYISTTTDFKTATIVRLPPGGGSSVTVAGGGTVTGSAANGSPATLASLTYPVYIAARADGALFLSEQRVHAVRIVGSNGLLAPFAGNGNGCCASFVEGSQALSETLQQPGHIAVARDGSLLIADGVGAASFVRRVAPDGTTMTVAGASTGSSLDGVPATEATLGAISLAVGPDGAVYIADDSASRLRAVATFAPAASEDGKEVYVFDNAGHHLQTLDAYTHAPLLTFGYDANWQLKSITDVNKDPTAINHNPNGTLSSIVSPFGIGTAFVPDTNGYIQSATDAAGQTTHFTYGVDGPGLMSTLTDVHGGLHEFHFDPTSGRLLKDQDPAGGSKTLSVPVSIDGGFSTQLTTRMGIQTTYQTSTTDDGVFRRVTTLPDLLTSSLAAGTNYVTTSTAPDNTTVQETDTPDPRFGITSPVRSLTTTTPGGLVRSETATLTLGGADAGVGASLDGGPPSVTEHLVVNGNPKQWTRTFDPNALTWTTASPDGRTSTVTVDSADRPLTIAVAGVTNPVQMTYDAHGRLKTVTQGTFVPGAPDSGAPPQPRTWTMNYDDAGYLAQVTDPMDASVSNVNDPIGRPQHTLLPEVDGGTRDLQTGFDGGDLTSVTLPRNPGQEQHQMQYTPVDQLSLYSPPSPDAGTWSTQDSYDFDGRLTRETRPDDSTLVPDYDSPAGRLAHITYPQGVLTLAYYPAGGPSPGNLQSITTPTSEALAFGYDGPLVTGLSWAGPVNGSVGFGYDPAFRMTTQTLNGGSPLSFGYDDDDLLTSAGAITSIARDPGNGRVTGSTLGAASDIYGYDPNGLLASYTAQYQGANIYVETIVSRDGDQRITERTETLQGTTTDWIYQYDIAGRLTDVFKNHAAVSHYGYDADDNRVSVTIGGVSTNPSYDVQDRLRTYGTASYSYGPNGELQTKTVGNESTGYLYDVFGNLLTVELPGGTEIDYLVDGQNRRIRKQVNGVTTDSFLYQDGLRLVARTDAAGNVTRFIYATRGNVPDYMVTTSPPATYRIFSDHLGSPRLIVNTATGAIAQQIDYDEFGNVTEDTSPGFQPFGFAGGFYDKDTALIRFGARDYDSAVGRWTSKDRIRFVGGWNLYGYCHSNPVNCIDRTGRDPTTAVVVGTVAAGAGEALTAGLIGAAALAALPWALAIHEGIQAWHEAYPPTVYGSPSTPVASPGITEGVGSVCDYAGKPKGLPTGSRPIDQWGLDRETIHKIKDGLDLAPDQGVWVDPEGNVWIDDGTGQGISIGHIDEA